MKSDEISFKELFVKFKEWFLYLRSKWLIILLFGLIGGTIGFIYASYQKPTYTATLSFALEDEKSGGGGLSGALGLASSLGIDLGTSAGGAFNGSNLIELMKSRKLVEQTLLNPVSLNNKNISLAEYYLIYTGLRETFNKNPNPQIQQLVLLPNSNRINFTLQQDSILGVIYSSLITNNLNISQKDKKISIVNISVKAENELFAKYFTETLAKEVSDFYINTKSRKARINVAILEKQSDSIRNELNNAITGVAQANDNTYNLNPSLNIKRTPSAKRQVDVQANTAILTELVKNLELAKVSLRKETPLIQIIDTPILPLKKEKVSRLKILFLSGFFASVIMMLFLAVKKYVGLIFK